MQDVAAPAVCVISTRKGRRLSKIRCPSTPWPRDVVLSGAPRDRPHRLTGQVDAISITATNRESGNLYRIDGLPKNRGDLHASRNTPENRGARALSAPASRDGTPVAWNKLMLDFKKVWLAAGLLMGPSGAQASVFLTWGDSLTFRAGRDRRAAYSGRRGWADGSGYVAWRALSFLYIRPQAGSFIKSSNDRFSEVASGQILVGRR